MEKTIPWFQKQRTKIKYCYVAVFAFVLASLLSVLIYKSALLAVVLAACAAAVYALLLRPISQKFIQDKIDHNQKEAYGKFLAELKIIPKDAFVRTELEKAALVPTQDKGFLVRNGLTGSYGAMPVMASEFCNYHQTDPENKKNHDLLFFTGTFVRVQLPMDTKIDLRLVHIGALAKKTMQSFFCRMQGLEQLELGENNEMQKAFMAFGHSGTEVWPGLRHAVLVLQQKARDNTLISIQGDMLYVVLQNTFIAPNFKVYDEISAERMNHCYAPELKAVLDFAGYLCKNNKEQA